MTFEQWAKAQGYRLTKHRGYYTSPATLAAQMAWRAGEQAERTRENRIKLRLVRG